MHVPAANNGALEYQVLQAQGVSFLHTATKKQDLVQVLSPFAAVITSLRYCTRRMPQDIKETTSLEKRQPNFIYKKGDVEELSNYRPTSLLSVEHRTLTKLIVIVNCKMTLYISNNQDSRLGSWGPHVSRLQDEASLPLGDRPSQWPQIA